MWTCLCGDFHTYGYCVDKIQNGTPFAPEKPWGTNASYKCRKCGRTGVVNGDCYTCTTGRPRTVLRPDESPAAV